MQPLTAPNSDVLRSLRLPKCALILDGETRTALSVVRSLGAIGIETIVAAARSNALAQTSRFALRRLICPDPAWQAEEFKAWLLNTVKRMRPDLVLPLTDLTVGLCSSMEELRGLARLPLVSGDVLAAVHNKGELLQTAAKLGISIPATLCLPAATRSRSEEAAQIYSFRYPAVLKAAVSVTEVQGESIRPPITYPAGADAVLDVIQGSTDERFQHISFLLQERVAGEGWGVFALCSRGKVLTYFCHRRLLEKPPSGGVSVLSESVPEKEAPVAQSLALLEHYQWHGVAMVEYKRDASGRFVLMEINPRLWGSLQLAVDCGRDFPMLLAALAMCENEDDFAKLEAYCAALPPYAAHCRLRWMLGTLDHALIGLKASPVRFLAAALFRNRLQLFSRFFHTRGEILRWDDRAPAFFELRDWLARR